MRVWRPRRACPSRNCQQASIAATLDVGVSEDWVGSPPSQQEGSGLAGVESAVLSRLADTGGQQSQQQHLDVSPASEQGQDVHCLCPAQAWPLARELPLSGGAEGPGGCLPTMPTLLGSLLAADLCGERGLPQSGA